MLYSDGVAGGTTAKRLWQNGRECRKASFYLFFYFFIIMLYSAEMQEMREMGGIRITRCTEGLKTKPTAFNTEFMIIKHY